MENLGGWFNHCRDGAKIVLYQLPLMQDTVEQEAIYKPNARAPKKHAEQARRILFDICEVLPGDFKPNDIKPRLSFFIGPASVRMINGVIYGADPELFALGVAHVFANSDVNARQSIHGVRGRHWMPLNVIAFAASFVSTFSFLLFSSLLTF